jgi:hypothetical protein
MGQNYNWFVTNIILYIRITVLNNPVQKSGPPFSKKDGPLLYKK